MNTDLNLLGSNENLTNYYYYKSALDDETIEEIKKIALKQDVIDGNVSGNINKNYRTSEIRWIPLNDETKQIYKIFVDLAKRANEDMWNFHITTIKDELQFTQYSSDNSGHYDWHLDFGGARSSTRKLSMVVQLTDPSEYEGGKLQFMINRDVIDAPQQKGTVIFFPSYLMHRVTNVEKGIRNSLVCWFHGPPFV